jgi:PAS domain S-box-containing protein
MSSDQPATKPLVEQQRRFQKRSQTTDTPACLLTPNGRIHDVNTAFCRLLDYQRGDVIGRLMSELTDPRDVDLTIVMLDLALAGKVQRLSFRQRDIDASGASLDVLVNGTLVKDAKSSPVCFLLEIASA